MQSAAGVIMPPLPMMAAAAAAARAAEGRSMFGSGGGLTPSPSSSPSGSSLPATLSPPHDRSFLEKAGEVSTLAAAHAFPQSQVSPAASSEAGSCYSGASSPNPRATTPPANNNNNYKTQQQVILAQKFRSKSTEESISSVNYLPSV